MELIRKSSLHGLTGAVAAFCLLSAGAAAEVSYEGETITIVVPYGPGGTYDKYGQTFARHLGGHIPGNPNIIVQHMPGAGGLKGMNWAYTVMPKDGKNLITPLDNSVVNQLMRPKAVRYDVSDFTWIGSSNQTNIVLVVRSDTGIRTFEDLKGRKLIAGASGKASTGYLFPGLLRGLFGLELEVVTGYSGSSKTIFSVERGETQMAAYNWLAWASKVPHWFKAEEPFARPIVQIGVFRDPDLPKDVPMVSDLVKDGTLDQKAVDFIKVLGLLGRGLALPPGVPEDAVATLRAAYDAMNEDPAFEADLVKRKLRLMPSKGADIQKIVGKAIAGATPEVVQHASQLIYGSEG